MMLPSFKGKINTLMSKSLSGTDSEVNRTLWNTKTRTCKGTERFLREDDSRTLCLKMSRRLLGELGEGQPEQRDQQTQRIRCVE